MKVILVLFVLALAKVFNPLSPKRSPIKRWVSYDHSDGRSYPIAEYKRSDPTDDVLKMLYDFEKELPLSNQLYSVNFQT